MFDPGVISLPGVLKNLKKNMAFTPDGVHFPFILIHLNRAVPWKTCLKKKGYLLILIK